MGSFLSTILAPLYAHYFVLAAELERLEESRAVSLLDAQSKAAKLFTEIEHILIRPGITESQLSKEIFDLSDKLFNLSNLRDYWHKRVVRSGPNTLHPYSANLADRTIGEDDILFIDLGPVFEKWEADFGRTFVLGKDPAKIKLRDSLQPVWNAAKACFDADPGMTGEQLFHIVQKLAKEAGYEHGGKHAGHLIGDLPHESIPNDKVTLYVTKGSKTKMRSRGKDGLLRHWILEVHLVDRERDIGGFFEQLLTIG